MVNISMVLALLVKYGNLERQTALDICRKLELGNQPTRFEDAERTIERVLREVG